MAFSLCSVFLHAHPEGHLPVTSRLSNGGDTLLEEVGEQLSSDRWVGFLERQEFFLSEDLAQFPSAYVPGAFVGNGDGAGISIRGGSVEATGLIISGLRISGQSGAVRDLFRYGTIYGYEELEQLRGSQGAVYGNNVSAGALGLFPQYGDSVASGKLTLEYGSSGRERVSVLHSAQKENYNYAFTGDYTSSNDLERWSIGSSLGWQINDYVEADFSFRLWSGDSFDGSRNESFDAGLLSFGLKAELTPWWQSRFVAGFYSDDFDGAGDREFESIQARWDNEFRVAQGQRLSFGLYYEDSEIERDFLNVGDQIVNARLAWSWDFLESITWSTNGLWQDSQIYGDDVGWRSSIVWRANEGGTVLRVSYGDSFDYASDLNQRDVDRGRSWDIGFEQSWRGTDRVSLAYFEAEHSFEERARGIEFRLRGQIGEEGAGYRVSYTNFFDVRDDVAQHLFSGSIDFRFFDNLVVGFGGSFQSGAEVAGEDLSSFVSTRIFAEYLLRDGVRIHGRIENLLDREDEVSSLDGEILRGEGFGVYGGVSFEW